MLRLLSTGDSRTLTLQTDHIYSNGALYFGDNSYATNFRGSSYNFSTGNATFDAKVKIQGNPPTTANTNFDDLVISDSAHAEMSIFSGTNEHHGAIYFGDPDANNRGQIKYLHILIVTGKQLSHQNLYLLL